ncbi:general stress protein [Bacillus sp. FJAT-18017]|jgi:Heat induced stress protein YflT|uniref:general stress protein n=1 Tax=unclassified Bacillus (in: firmicutes) TaxID=185979 RepID=UPI0005C7392A|nr:MULTISPECIES: general stress protein [unclassified Bacillus (in: firmicutes)]ALC88651.1 general stress protein [Bacillus sp. FJAT-18017]
MYKVEIVENGVQAQDKLSLLATEGYKKDDIYLFAHDKKRESHLADATGAEEVGLTDQGLINSVTGVFKKRGDELRTQFQSLGLSESEADRLEKELDEGRLVLVACKK